MVLRKGLEITVTGSSVEVGLGVSVLFSGLPAVPVCMGIPGVIMATVWLGFEELAGMVGCGVFEGKLVLDGRAVFVSVADVFWVAVLVMAGVLT